MLFQASIFADRDKIFAGLNTLGFTEIVTAKASPWQNAFFERVIGTIRRECTDHFLFYNEAHLQRVLDQYLEYYNQARTHLSLNQDAPISREVQRQGRIIAIEQAAGLHHRYERRTA